MIKIEHLCSHTSGFNDYVNASISVFLMERDEWP